jgi:hypothetical protein
MGEKQKKIPVVQAISRVYTSPELLKRLNDNLNTSEIYLEVAKDVIKSPEYFSKEELERSIEILREKAQDFGGTVKVKNNSVTFKEKPLPERYNVAVWYSAYSKEQMYGACMSLEGLVVEDNLILTEGLVNDLFEKHPKHPTIGNTVDLIVYPEKKVTVPNKDVLDFYLRIGRYTNSTGTTIESTGVNYCFNIKIEQQKKNSIKGSDLSKTHPIQISGNNIDISVNDGKIKHYFFEPVSWDLKDNSCIKFCGYSNVGDLIFITNVTHSNGEYQVSNNGPIPFSIGIAKYQKDK